MEPTNSNNNEKGYGPLASTGIVLGAIAVVTVFLVLLKFLLS